MTPVTLWRTIAVVSTLGWGATALAWMAVPTTASAPISTTEPMAHRATPPHGELARPRPAQPSPMARSEHARPSHGPDITQIRQDVRDEVWEEVEQERAERRRARSELHVARLLERAAEFAATHELDAHTQAMLESSTLTMHEALEELRPDGPPGPNGPPQETIEAIEAAFEQFREEVADTLDDVELSDAYTERMTPRPLRDRPRN